MRDRQTDVSVFESSHNKNQWIGFRLDIEPIFIRTTFMLAAVSHMFPFCFRIYGRIFMEKMLATDFAGHNSIL